MQINFAPAYFASGQNVCDIALHLSGYWHNIHRIASLKVRGLLISQDHRKRAFARNFKILQFSAKHSLRNGPLQTCSRKYLHCEYPTETVHTHPSQDTSIPNEQVMGECKPQKYNLPARTRLNQD